MTSSGLAKDDVRGQLGFVWFSFPPVGQFPLLMCLHAPAGPGYLWSRRASGATKNASISTFTFLSVQPYRRVASSNLLFMGGSLSPIFKILFIACCRGKHI